jgi:glycerol-3-phosphate dehydrogenase
MSSPLIRDLDALATRTFDVLVIGGGVYGLTVACDAAQRGLSVALVERHDFGSGTSFNHLRTIHGGLRYLQHLDIARARESVRERRTLAHIAPWAVRPTPFVLPLGRSLTRGPMAMRAGFLLDRIIASDRNEGLPPSHHLPAGRVMRRSDVLKDHPDLERIDFTSAAVWFDYVAIDADRLTLAWGLTAAGRGAQLANYVDATSIVARGGHVVGARLVDRIGGTEFAVHSRTVVNATGSGIDHLLHPFHADTRLPFLQAVNLVTSHPAPSAAVGGRSAVGRNLFLVPWQGRALFGTWESPTTCAPEALTVRDEDLETFIAELDQAFPSYRLEREDVTLIHRGVVPAHVRPGNAPTLEGHELVFEEAIEGLSGLISVAGTKYTTARAVAERIVNRLLVLLGAAPRECVSTRTPLVHVPLHGDELLRHAAKNEMVMSLADAVMRRTTIGALGCPDEDTLTHAASVVGEVLGWTDDRQRAEIAALQRMY